MSHQTCKRCLTIFVMTNEEHNTHCKSIHGNFLREDGAICSIAAVPFVSILSSILAIWSNIAYMSATPSQCGMLRCAAPGVHWHYMTTLHWSRPRTLASLRVKCYHRHHTLAPPHISWAYLLDLTYHGCIC